MTGAGSVTGVLASSLVTVAAAASFSRPGSGMTSSAAGGGSLRPVIRPAHAAKTSLSGLFSIRPLRYSRTTWTTSVWLRPGS